MKKELIYQVALTQIPSIGCIQTKILLEHFGSAEAIFMAKKKELAAVEGIGEIRASQVKAFCDISAAEKEVDFIEKNNIRALSLSDPAYPKRLRHCADAPSLLYYKGKANLNTSKVISIIGTRNNTDYGRWVTEQLIEALQPLDVLVVSGLAFGIDGIAHKAALHEQLSTVGVLAHGLDTIYPIHHQTLAREMIQQGGLLTEFGRGVKPDKHNFPRRNRIVAGLSDATVVIETAEKGGSIITAELACSYNRDLFAVPGRINDAKSAGCLKLIAQNKAILLNNAEQLQEVMGWIQIEKKPKPQKDMFVELGDQEKVLVDILQQRGCIHIDELYIKSNLSNSTVAAALLNLELQQVIRSLPGKLYQLN